MSQLRRIIFVTYEGAEILDLTGPSSVFSTACRLANQPVYETIIISSAGGLVKHSCGTRLETRRSDQFDFTESDTVLIVGSYEEALQRAAEDEGLHRLMRRASASAERYGSICSGTFILAEAGLLNEGKVTTHWMARESFEHRYPGLLAADDPLYVANDRLWTSAGVTTGIDMALAILEKDHGTNLKARTARQLAVYAHRHGKQAQFSAILDAQNRLDLSFFGLFDWLNNNIERAVSVNDMANFVGMSRRSFYRRFKSEIGEPPAKFVDRLRFQRAREILEAGQPVKIVANKVGFGSEAAFRSAFKNHFGLPPGHFNGRF